MSSLGGPTLKRNALKLQKCQKGRSNCPHVGQNKKTMIPLQAMASPKSLYVEVQFKLNLLFFRTSKRCIEEKHSRSLLQVPFGTTQQLFRNHIRI